MKKQKEEKNFIKKPFSIGFYSSLAIGIILILVIIFSFLNVFQQITGILSILSFFLYLLALASFFHLGKKYQNNILRKSSITLGVISIIGIILGVLFLINLFNNLASNPEIMEKILTASQTKQELDEETSFFLINSLIPSFIFILIFYLIYAIIFTIFSVGLIKLKESSYARTLGILNIITIWLPVTIIGILNIIKVWLPLTIIRIFIFIPMNIACLVFQCLLFYEQAKKFKEINGKS